MKNKNLLNNAPFGQKNKLGITYQINILPCGDLQFLLIKRGEGKRFLVGKNHPRNH